MISFRSKAVGVVLTFGLHVLCCWQHAIMQVSFGQDLLGLPQCPPRPQMMIVKLEDRNC